MGAEYPIAETVKPKLFWYQHVWLALPLALIAVGGAIGGVCGGMACAFNYKTFRNTGHPVLRYVLTGLVSLTAVGAYLVLASAFVLLIEAISARL